MHYAPVRHAKRRLAGRTTPPLSHLRPTAPKRARGQTLVEFSLVFPLFLVLMMSVIEFAFAFNATLSLAFASRDAALIAAESGSAAGSDCVIIQAAVDDVSAPADPNSITSIEIFWSDANGNYKNGDTTLKNVWNHTGSTTCVYPDGSTLTVPYTRATNGYPDTARCNVEMGCGGSHTPSVDTIGIRVSYTYAWKTPLKGLIGMVGGGGAWTGTGWNFNRANAMRMEPVL